jgi:hypothetical protein
MKLSEEISQKRWNFGWNFRENDELVIDDTLDFLKRLALQVEALERPLERPLERRCDRGLVTGPLA